MAVSTNDSAAMTVAGFMMDNASKSAWPGVQKADVVSGLLERLQDANKINQQQSPYCGPTSFFRSLLLDDPVAYVTAVIDMYQTGKATIGSLVIKPGDETRTSATQYGLSAVEWLTLAALRDSENSVFSSAGWFGDSLAGITVPGGLTDWFAKAGYKEAKNYAAVTHGLMSAKELWSHAYTAGLYAQRGYRVCLFVDSDVLYTSNQEDSVSMWPDHWIVLESAVGPHIPYTERIAVTATVFSWGKTRPLAQDPTKPVSAGGFVNKYYGFVAAKR